MQRGFTLLEVMVATFIFALAITAFSAVLGRSANSVATIEQRQFALLSAHNRLALALTGEPDAEGSLHNGGYDFTWTLQRHPTTDANLSRLEVQIYSTTDASPQLTLKGFQENAR